jgi:hypothetical protein
VRSREEAEAVGHAAGPEALDPQADQDVVGVLQLGEVGAARFGNDADHAEVVA